VRLTTVFNKLLSLQGAVVRDVVFGARHMEVTVARQARSIRPRNTISREQVRIGRLVGNGATRG